MEHYCMRLSAAAMQTRGVSSLEKGFSGSHYLGDHLAPIARLANGSRPTDCQTFRYSSLAAALHWPNVPATYKTPHPTVMTEALEESPNLATSTWPGATASHDLRS